MGPLEPSRARVAVSWDGCGSPPRPRRRYARIWPLLLFPWSSNGPNTPKPLSCHTGRPSEAATSSRRSGAWWRCRIGTRRKWHRSGWCVALQRWFLRAEHLTHQQYAQRARLADQTLAALLQQADRKAKALERKLEALAAAESELARRQVDFAARAKAVTRNQRARLQWLELAESALREYVSPDVERLLEMISRRAVASTKGCIAELDMLDNLRRPTDRPGSVRTGHHTDRDLAEEPDSGPGLMLR